MEILKKSEVNENTHCDPLGIYGALKFSAEKIIIAYNQVLNSLIQLSGHQHFMEKDV